jgi:hypothetical protein
VDAFTQISNLLIELHNYTVGEKSPKNFVVLDNDSIDGARDFFESIYVRRDKVNKLSAPKAEHILDKVHSILEIKKQLLHAVKLSAISNEQLNQFFDTYTSELFKIASECLYESNAYIGKLNEPLSFLNSEIYHRIVNLIDDFLKFIKVHFQEFLPIDFDKSFANIYYNLGNSNYYSSLTFEDIKNVSVNFIRSFLAFNQVIHDIDFLHEEINIDSIDNLISGDFNPIKYKELDKESIIIENYNEKNAYLNNPDVRISNINEAEFKDIFDQQKAFSQAVEPNNFILIPKYEVDSSVSNITHRINNYYEQAYNIPFGQDLSIYVSDFENDYYRFDFFPLDYESFRDVVSPKKYIYAEIIKIVQLEFIQNLKQLEQLNETKLKLELNRIRNKIKAYLQTIKDSIWDQLTQYKILKDQKSKSVESLVNRYIFYYHPYKKTPFRTNIDILFKIKRLSENLEEKILVVFEPFLTPRNKDKELPQRTKNDLSNQKEYHYFGWKGKNPVEQIEKLHDGLINEGLIDSKTPLEKLTRLFSNDVVEDDLKIKWLSDNLYLGHLIFILKTYQYSECDYYDMITTLFKVFIDSKGNQIKNLRQSAYNLREKINFTSQETKAIEQIVNSLNAINN